MISMLSLGDAGLCQDWHTPDRLPDAFQEDSACRSRAFAPCRKDNTGDILFSKEVKVGGSGRACF